MHTPSIVSKESPMPVVRLLPVVAVLFFFSAVLMPLLQFCSFLTGPTFHCPRLSSPHHISSSDSFVAEPSTSIRPLSSKVTAVPPVAFCRGFDFPSPMEMPGEIAVSVAVGDRFIDRSTGELETAHAFRCESLPVSVSVAATMPLPPSLAASFPSVYESPPGAMASVAMLLPPSLAAFSPFPFIDHHSPDCPYAFQHALWTIARMAM